MKKIILLPLMCASLVATTPFSATAMNPPVVGQSLEVGSTPLLAQYRRNYNRRNYNQPYSVYYRRPGQSQWTFQGSHSMRGNANRATRRLQQNGYITFMRELMYGRGNYGRYRDR
jgi:hypothetical protein